MGIPSRVIGPLFDVKIMFGYGNLGSIVPNHLGLSRGEARRLAEQGGFSIDDVKVGDVDLPFITVLGDRNAVLLRAGRKRFLRVMMS